MSWLARGEDPLAQQDETEDGRGEVRQQEHRDLDEA
jgi:hypothetical protein